MTSDAILEMRNNYLLDHGRCAYCESVPKDEYPHCNNERFDLEHIFQRLGQRIDDPANYVVCCRISHQWKHMNSIEGRIAALHWKWKHGELDVERLQDLTGLNVLGWMSNRKESGLPAWAAKLVDEVVNAHSPKEKQEDRTDAGDSRSPSAQP